MVTRGTGQRCRTAAPALRDGAAPPFKECGCKAENWNDNAASGSSALACHIEMVKASNPYQTKAIQGDFTKTVFARFNGVDADNSFAVVIMMFYNYTATAA